jgi:hypothetical protein
MLFMSFAAHHLRSIWGANIVVFKLGPTCVMLFLMTNTRFLVRPSIGLFGFRPKENTVTQQAIVKEIL